MIVLLLSQTVRYGFGFYIGDEEVREKSPKAHLLFN
jgi:hypothetical protein